MLENTFIKTTSNLQNANYLQINTITSPVSLTQHPLFPSPKYQKVSSRYLLSL